MSTSAGQVPVRDQVVLEWNALFHEQVPLLSLGLFRILFAAILWAEISTTRAVSLFAIEGGFHLPYLSFIPLVSPDTYAVLHGPVQSVLIVLLGLGVLVRWSCAGLLLLQGFVFFSDALHYRNHAYFFLLVLLLLMLSPCHRAMSISALVSAIRRRQPIFESLFEQRGPVTMQRLLQIQVCLVYIYAGLHKCTEFFFSGKVLSYHLAASTFYWRRYFEWFMNEEDAARWQEKFLSPEMQVWPSIITLVLELGLPFALCWRRSRPWALVIGVLFHVGIAMLMNIWTFSMAMIGSYLLFLDSQTLPRLIRRMAGRTTVEVPAGATRAQRRRAARSSKRKA